MKSWPIAEPIIMAGAKGIDTFLRNKPHTPPIIHAASRTITNCMNVWIEDPNTKPSFTSPNPMLPFEIRLKASSIAR